MLGNKVMVGTVNASRENFETGVADLAQAEAEYPGWLARLLTHRVGILNEMDEGDLRQHYMKLLANDGRTERGGAGLGLLTMARKSARPMVVRTLPRDGDSAYFALELAVLRA